MQQKAAKTQQDIESGDANTMWTSDHFSAKYVDTWYLDMFKRVFTIFFYTAN